MPKKIGILIGSLRKDSYNRKIATYIIENYSHLADFEIIEIKDFPLFNEDLENNPPEAILKARKQITPKNGIIFISPEYNHSISGVMKNALDWFSRGDLVLMKKPYLLMGASTGMIGTARSQGHFGQILNTGAFQMYSLPNNEFLFARVQDIFDDTGKIINPGTITRLEKKLAALLAYVDKIEKHFT